MELRIDQLTPCLVSAKTGEQIDTVFSKVSLRDRKDIKGWAFDWADPVLDQDEVYRLSVVGQTATEGLVAIRYLERDRAVYVHIAESAPHNKGINKKYIGVGGHLFAIAAQKSMEAGFGGFFFLDAKNLDLVHHYQKALGAVWLGMPHEYRMIVEEDSAAKLLETYHLEEVSK
jgi:hypothetical protein